MNWESIRFMFTSEQFGANLAERKSFKRLPLSPSFCLKLYNDKITLTEYVKRRIRYRYFNEYYKMDTDTGELIPWGYLDSLRLNKSYICSLSRSLRLIKEISDKNVFTHFITITFNDDYLDRHSPEEVHVVFKKVIKRFKYKYGELMYLAVPEFHDDGAIHYHCLFKFFNRRPRLFFKRYTLKGEKLFYITDKFFKEDIFVTVELLSGDNNIEYLTKYMTKGNEKPLPRRFSCSRNVNRSRLIKSVSLPSSVSYKYFRLAKNRGFEVQTNTKNITSIKYDLWTRNMSGGVGGAAADPRSDSFNVDIKDEKSLTTQRLYELLLEDFERERKLASGKAVKYGEKECLIKSDRNGQMSFLLV